jgi:hypothetical protein
MESIKVKPPEWFDKQAPTKCWNCKKPTKNAAFCNYKCFFEYTNKQRKAIIKKLKKILR